MDLPPVKFDWTISLGHLASACVFIGGGLFAYTDLKSDVRNQQTVADAKYREYDRLWSQQQKLDDDQNQRMLRIFDTLSRQLTEAKADIRGDIRDLRERKIK